MLAGSGGELIIQNFSSGTFSLGSYVGPSSALTVSGTGNVSLNGAMVFTSASNTITVDTNSGSTVVNGGITLFSTVVAPTTAAATITNNGSSALTINGGVSYAPGATSNAVAFNANGSGGINVNGPIVFTTVGAIVNGVSVPAPTSLTNGGTGTGGVTTGFASTITLTGTGFTLTNTAPAAFTLNGAVTANAVPIVITNNGGTLTQTGLITFTNGNSVTFSGSGFTNVAGGITFAGALPASIVNNGTGTAAISDGTFTTASALTLVNATTITNNSSGSLVIEAAVTANANFITINGSGTGAVNIPSLITFTAAQAVSITNSPALFTTTLGGITLTAAGAGAGVNTFFLNNNASTPLTVSGVVTVAAGNNVTIGGTGSGAVTNGQFPAGLAFAVSSTLLNAPTGATNFTTTLGGITLAGNNSYLTLTNNASTTLTITNSVNFTGAIGANLVINGTGTTAISGVVNFSVAGVFNNQPLVYSITNAPTGGTGTTISGPIVLGYSTTITNNASTALNISGVISNGFNINPVTANTLTINGTGTTNISGQIGLGYGGLTVGGGATVNLSGTAANGPNTYLGATTISQGTLAVTYNAGVSSALISSASALSIGAGTLSLTGASNTASIQILGNLTVAGGPAAITLAPTGSGQMNLTLGNAWTRSTGATLNITAPASTSLTSSPTNTNQIIGGWAVFNGTDWASNFNSISSPSVFQSTVGALAASNYTPNAGTWLAANNLQYTSNTGVTITTGLVANSIQFTTPTGASTTVTLGGGGAYTLNSGGILVSSAVGSANTTIALTTAESIGAVSGDLIIQNYSTGVFTLSAKVAANAAGITFGGTGSTTVSGAVAFTAAGAFTNNTTGSAAVTLSAPTLTLNGALAINDFGSGSFTISSAIAAGTNTITIVGPGSGAIALSGGISYSGAANFVNNNTFATTTLGNVALGGLLTISGAGNTTVGGASVISGATFGLTMAGTGTLTFNGTTLSTYSGTTTVAGGGTLAVNFANASSPTGGLIGNNAGLLNLGATAPGFGGTISFTAQNNIASKQTLGNLTVAGGASTIALNNSGTGTMTLQLGTTWTHVAGGTLNITGNGILASNVTGSKRRRGAQRLDHRQRFRFRHGHWRQRRGHARLHRGADECHCLGGDGARRDRPQLYEPNHDSRRRQCVRQQHQAGRFGRRSSRRCIPRSGHDHQHRRHSHFQFHWRQCPASASARSPTQCRPHRAANYSSRISTRRHWVCLHWPH